MDLLNEQMSYASAELCKHTRHICKRVLDILCLSYPCCVGVWDITRWSLGTMSAAALSAQSFGVHRTTTTKVRDTKDREPRIKQERLQQLHSQHFSFLGKNSRRQQWSTGAPLYIRSPGRNKEFGSTIHYNPSNF